MTLAEIIQEAERLEGEVLSARNDSMPKSAAVLQERLDEFLAKHGPRLLAVARAAVEYRAAAEAEAEARFNMGYAPMALSDRLEWAERAFDDAAKGGTR
jgi:hypothetical protein